MLLSKEGKSLVQAQYAIRNNQRNFLKITLPLRRGHMERVVTGKPVRPGELKDGSLLLPLEKSRAGEEAPAFVLESSILSANPHGQTKAKPNWRCPP